MKKNFKKLTTLTLAAALTVGTVCATPITAHAKSYADWTFEDIVNSVWGPSGKDKYGEVEDNGYRNGGQTVDEIDWSDNGLVSTPDPAPAPDPEPAPAPDNSSSDSDDSYTSEDFDSSGSNESYTPADSGSSNESHDSGSSDSGSASTSAPSQSAPAQPDTTAGAPASAPVVSVTDAAGNVTAVKVTATAPVTDEAFLAAYPGATFVLAPNGFTTIAVTDTTKTVFQVYFTGTVADEFRIMDAKNKFVAISAFQFVTEATGKTYVDVTVDAKTKNPVVAASAEQKAAFARLFGIDGVMINGVLAEEFDPNPVLAN